MNRKDKTIIQKMLKYCEEIEGTNTFFANDKALFLDESKGYVYRNSISMALLQIGELAKHLSDDFLAAHSLIAWKEIIRMRDFFAHHYGNSSFSQVWDTAHQDIKDLKSFLESIDQ